MYLLKIPRTPDVLPRPLDGMDYSMKPSMSVTKLWRQEMGLGGLVAPPLLDTEVGDVWPNEKTTGSWRVLS